jgi:hypothetical protein
MTQALAAYAAFSAAVWAGTCVFRAITRDLDVPIEQEQRTQARRPDPLLWEFRTDSSGRRYLYHAGTGEVRWPPEE